jgi:hypothetical protein
MNFSMRGRIVKVAVALCGLAGAVYAADEATAPAPGDLNRALVTQLVNEGRLANALPNAPADTKYTSEQMMILAPKYGADMEGAIEHAKDVRIVAYREHDIIRMTCIDDKLVQMKTLENLASPRMMMMRTFKAEPIVMRVEFDVISQVHDRVTVLGSEVDACMGDSLDAVSSGRIHEENQFSNTDINDPTRPPSPFESIERPPAASPYN